MSKLFSRNVSVRRSAWLAARVMAAMLLAVGLQLSSSHAQEVSATDADSAASPESPASPASPAEQTDGDERNGKTVEYWVEQLGHEHYLRREMASKKLVAAGPAAVEQLSAAIRSGDLEVVERAAAAMIEIAVNASPRKDGGAYDRLQALSLQAVGRPASVARGALLQVKTHRRGQARRELTGAGIVVGLSEFAIGALSQQRMLVEIGDSWNGDTEALQWLEWLDGIDNAKVSGKAASAEVIGNIARMPDLQSLIIVDAKIDDAVLQPLTEMDRLNTLDLRYVRLNDQQGDLIAKIPLRTSLILMGTGLSEQKVETLRAALPGLQIQYRRGGFLGVMCIDNFDACEITGIQENSAAEAAGLIRGDVIIQIDGVDIKHFRDLQQAINEHVPGDEVEVRFRRAGRVDSVKLRLRRYEES